MTRSRHGNAFRIIGLLSGNQTITARNIAPLMFSLLLARRGYKDSRVTDDLRRHGVQMTSLLCSILAHCLKWSVKTWKGLSWGADRGNNYIFNKWIKLLSRLNILISSSHPLIILESREHFSVKFLCIACTFIWFLIFTFAFPLQASNIQITLRGAFENKYYYPLS